MTVVIPDPKYVLSLASQIEETKGRLAQLQAKWDALFSPQPGPVEASSERQVARKRTGRKAAPNGLASKVIRAIESEPLHEWDAERIGDQTHIPLKQVRKALTNLYAGHRIQRTGRGVYAANSYRPTPTPVASLAAVN
jgi:hypothetical protein